MTNSIDSIILFTDPLRIVFQRRHRTARYSNPSPSSLRRLCMLLNKRVSYSSKPRGTLYVYPDGWKWDTFSLLAT